MSEELLLVCMMYKTWNISVNGVKAVIEGELVGVERCYDTI